MSDNIKKNTIFQNLTFSMIILVLIQLFLENFFLIYGFDITLIKKIKLSAIIFDTYFTLEFFIKSIIYLKNRNWKNYFFNQSGWVDFISSIPLLLFISLPEFFYQIFNINIFLINYFSGINILIIVKMIRVIKLLRFMRIIKMIKKSNINRRHIKKIITIFVTSIVVFYTFTAFLEESEILSSKMNKINIDEINKTRIIKQIMETADKNNIKNILSENNIADIVLIKYNNLSIFTSKNYFTEEFLYYMRNPFINEYIKTYEISNSIDKLNITFSRHKIIKEESGENMITLLFITFILSMLFIFYNKFFTKTISIPVSIMRKGFEDRNYIYVVKIPKQYVEDDVFILSNDYNTKWLPAKIRKLNETNPKEKSKLSLNDVFKNNL